MRFPLLAKPYWTDREGAHDLALVHGRKALAALVAGTSGAGLQLPLTVHQYVDHGGCLFKVGLRCAVGLQSERGCITVQAGHC